MIIITHPGQAHRDELIAISLILQAYPGNTGEVYRRRPTEEELNNPTTWVVDIGMQHQPELCNFDHHQDGAEGCAMSQVAEFLGLTAALKTRNWWEPTITLDTAGPTALAMELGIMPSILDNLYSPIEKWLLGEMEIFSGDTPLNLTMVQALRSLGRTLVEEAEAYTTGMQELQSSYVRQVGPHVNALVSECVTNTEAVGAVRKTLGAHMASPISVAISWDDRGEGWTLYRYDDDPDVDFSRLALDPRIEFAHKGGFIAKTKTRLDIEEVLEMCKAACI